MSARKRRGRGAGPWDSTRFPTKCTRDASITSRGWSVFSHLETVVAVLFPAEAGMNRSKKQTHPLTVE